MLNKIDKRLSERISSTQCKNKDIDVIVYLNNYAKDIVDIENRYEDIIRLPFISSVAMKTSLGAIANIANLNCVKYITDSSKVCSQIFYSKKFIGIENLYSIMKTYNSQSVAIIDTGIYPHIDFLLGKNRVIKFVDLIQYKEKMYDDNGHGTFIAGVLAGSGIAGKYSGIDKNTGLIVIKALDSDGETNTSKILEAMQWVLDNKEKYNINTVCMSFGSVYREGDPLVRGVNILWDEGITVVTAGGNSGPDDGTIMSPGTSRKVITVGSLSNVKETPWSVADFSSRGPVENYYKPDMVLPGTDIVSTAIFTDNHKFYTTMSGTSVSTPMVAGVCSLLKSINPNYTPNQIKYMLISSCVRMGEDRNAEGFGYLDLRNIRLL